MSKKENPHCPYCNSDDVGAEGTTSWDVETQAWVLNDTYDGGFCRACEKDIKNFVWKEE